MLITLREASKGTLGLQTMSNSRKLNGTYCSPDHQLVQQPGSIDFSEFITIYAK